MGHAHGAARSRLSVGEGAHGHDHGGEGAHGTAREQHVRDVVGECGNLDVLAGCAGLLGRNVAQVIGAALVPGKVIGAALVPGKVVAVLGDSAPARHGLAVRILVDA